MKKLLRQFVSLVSFAALIAAPLFAQSGGSSTPRREHLLNQLAVLIWTQPQSEKLSINLRVHSGAAFDPQGKEGAICLLTDVMFPDTGIYEDFKENFGGSLKITCAYDFIEIETEATPDKLVPVLEVFAGAVRDPSIDKETTALAKKARLANLEASERNSQLMADVETAERLYGDFPYGRPLTGTSESVSKIDFADLIYLKRRLLTSDNATLSIAGNLKPSFVYRAARRIFGGWEKGNGRVPANFTVPDAPEETPLTVNTEFGSNVEERLAVETASRTSTDFYNSKILYRVLQDRFKTHSESSLNYHYYLLRGYYVLGKSEPENVISEDSDESPADGLLTMFRKVISEPVTAAEFAKARKFELAEFSGRGNYRNWFDVETYGLKSVKDELSKLEAVTIEGVTEYAARISKSPVVRVVVVPLEESQPAGATDPKDPR